MNKRLTDQKYSHTPPLRSQSFNVVSLPGLPPTQVNSSSPFPESKHGRHFSSESTYSQSSAEDSRPDVAGSTHSSGCRSTHRERRSWQDLIETPLTSSGLHFLQTVPAEAESVYGAAVTAGIGGGGGRLPMSPERRRQATLPVQRRHHQDRDGPFPLAGSEEYGSHTHRRAHKQRSQSLPRNREVRGPRGVLHPAGPSEEKSEDDEVPFFKHKAGELPMMQGCAFGINWHTVTR